MLSLPTAMDCNQQRNARNRARSSICLTGNNVREEVTFDPQSARVRRIVEYLSHKSALYPDIRPGGMIQSDAFSR
jgi:hypothetical protein